jgi:hypothetical protein
MFETLPSSVMSLIALVGFFCVAFYGCEAWHNTQHGKGKRGAQFDHNDARGLGLLMIPITLMIICGCVAVVFHSIVWLIEVLSSSPII